MLHLGLGDRPQKLGLEPLKRRGTEGCVRGKEGMWRFKQEGAENGHEECAAAKYQKHAKHLPAS